MEKKKRKRTKSNGEGSIWTVKRNGKTYYMGAITVGFDTDGKQIKKTTGSFKRSNVVDRLNTYKYEAKNSVLSSDPNITLGALYHKWIFLYKKNGVQNNTFAEYEVCGRLRLYPYPIASIKVAKLDLDTLQEYFNSLKLNWSANVIKKTFVKLNACLQFANDINIIKKNYCKSIVLPKIQKKKEDEYKVFEKEEQDLIIENLEFTNVVDRLIYFTFYTGVRLGEGIAARESRIVGKMYQVREQYQKDIQIDENGNRKTTYIFKDLLKTPHAERDLPLPDKVLKLLTMYPHVSDLIFGDEKGNPIHVKRPDRRIKAICKKLGLDNSRTFHSVRHSYCTRLFEANVPIKTVQMLMGHADIETTLNIYTHVMKNKKMEVADILEAI
ncbi:integrase [Fusobacterium necrophorum BFTR-2]|nr:site-specific integrase [Fusobacterium necrophorum]KDE74877.1 integrase [Fusobacterium necrophorum BFTR-2]